MANGLGFSSACVVYRVDWAVGLGRAVGPYGRGLLFSILSAASQTVSPRCFEVADDGFIGIRFVLFINNLTSCYETSLGVARSSSRCATWFQIRQEAACGESLNIGCVCPV